MAAPTRELVGCRCTHAKLPHANGQLVAGTSSVTRCWAAPHAIEEDTRGLAPAHVFSLLSLSSLRTLLSPCVIFFLRVVYRVPENDSNFSRYRSTTTAFRARRGHSYRRTAFSHTGTPRGGAGPAAVPIWISPEAPIIAAAAFASSRRRWFSARAASDLCSQAAYYVSMAAVG